MGAVVGGQRLCPRCGSTSDLSHSSSSAHPKTSAPSAVVDFSCKSLTFEGAEAGAMGAIIDPRSRGQSRLVRELGAEAMPPLCQYLFSP
jgi:hypothetical protein